MSRSDPCYPADERIPGLTPGCTGDKKSPVKIIDIDDLVPTMAVVRRSHCF